MFDRLKAKARLLRIELSAIYFALQDKRLGWLPRMTGLLVIGYALSPIDLIPDFIPVLGYLDDLVIVPLLISLTIHLIPNRLLGECREKAESDPVQLRKKPWLALPVIALWTAIFFLILRRFLEPL